MISWSGVTEFGRRPSPSHVGRSDGGYPTDLLEVVFRELPLNSVLRSSCKGASRRTATTLILVHNVRVRSPLRREVTIAAQGLGGACHFARPFTVSIS
jgi:hypothetical protein